MPTYEVRNVIEPQRRDPDLEVVAELDPGGPFARPPSFAENVLARQFSFFGRSMLPYAPLQGDAYPWKLLRSPEAQVAGRDGVVLFGGGWVDTIQLLFANLNREGAQLRRTDRAVEAPAPTRRLEGPCLLAFNPAYHNYAHWTLDQAPLLALALRHPALAGCRILLPRTRPGHFIEQALELIGLPEERIVRLGDEVVQVAELLLPTYFSFDRIPVLAGCGAERLKAAVVEAGSPIPSAARRLFVSRPDTDNRPLLNEAAVLEALAPWGFEVITPGQASLMEQIRAFDAAEIIVGPHGAGLANAIYARGGGALIELFSEYTLNAIFWNVAALAGLDYGYVVGSSFDQDHALTDQDGSWNGPYVVDAAAVAEAVRRALNRPRPCLRTRSATEAHAP